MSNVGKTDSAKSCPSADLLLRCAHGHADADEVARLRKHLDECPTCTADYESLELLELEMLLAESDRDELTDFTPTDLCCELTDNRLAEIRTSDQPPGDERIQQHLVKCAYCRQRLLLPQWPSQASLRDEITGAMLERPLARARRAVAARVAWDQKEGLAGRLYAWVNEAGATVAAGLDTLRRRPVPVYARMGRPKKLDKAAECERVVWEIPVAEIDLIITIEVDPGHARGMWHLTCRVDADGETRIPDDAQIEIRDDGDQLTFCDNLRKVLNEPVRLETGAWKLTFILGRDVRVVPISVGLQPPEAST